MRRPPLPQRGRGAACRPVPREGRAALPGGRLRVLAVAALALGLASAGAAGGAAAFTPPPGAEPTAARHLPFATVALPEGPWAPGGPPLRRAEGEVAVTAWRLPLPEGGTAALMAGLRRALEAAGYRILFDCAARDCGGFDFRFALELLPEPEMHVDLGDYRYLLAEGPGPAGAAPLLALVVSRSRLGAHLQATEVTPAPPPAEAAPPPPASAAEAPAPPSPPPVPPTLPPPGPPAAAEAPADPAAAFAAALEERGAVALEDLRFESGAARLGPGPFPSLEALRAYLAARPLARVVLVGHSDATGPLAANIALSRARAEAVVERLVAMGADRRQLAAEGVGYLAPRAGNLSPEGRALNRRVEVVLIPAPAAP